MRKTQKVKSKAGKYYYYKFDDSGKRVRATKDEYYKLYKPYLQKTLKKAYKANKAKVIVTKQGVVDKEALAEFLFRKNANPSDEAAYREIVDSAIKRSLKKSITEVQLEYNFNAKFQEKTNKRLQAALANLGVDAETFAKMYDIDYNEFINAKNWEDDKFTDKATGITWELVYDYTDTAYLEPINE